MSKILITGINGFTGKYVAERFSKEGYDTVGLVHADQPSTEGQVSCDLNNKHAVSEALCKLKPDGLIHLAALSFVGHAYEEEFYRTNILGTMNLLEAYHQFGNKQGKVIIASSANIYGTPDIDTIDESICPSPLNHYAASKTAMEHMVRTWFDRLSIIITRPFNYTGPGQSGHFLVPKIVNHFKDRKESIELGNLDVFRDFSDVRDVSEAYFRLFHSRVASETFNICSGQVSSVQDIISYMNKLCGYQIDVHVNPAFVRENEIKLLKGSGKKLEAITGFKPSITLKTTLEDMLTG